MPAVKVLKPSSFDEEVSLVHDDSEDVVALEDHDINTVVPFVEEPTDSLWVGIRAQWVETE